MHGKGCLSLKNGSTLDGNWNNGKLVGEVTITLLRKPSQQVQANDILKWGAENGDTGILSFFLSRDNVSPETKTNTLSSAVENGHTEVVQNLIQTGADANEALIKVAGDGDTDAVKTLIQAGANANDVLIEAAKKGREEIVKTLIQTGADANEALIKVAGDGNTDAVKPLIK